MNKDMCTGNIMCKKTTTRFKYRVTLKGCPIHPLFSSDVERKRRGLVNFARIFFLLPAKLSVTGDLLWVLSIYTAPTSGYCSDLHLHHSAVPVSTPSSSNMSQARVTDFFSQRKKGIAEPVKAGKPSRSTAVGRGSAGITSNVSRTRSLQNKGDLPLSSSVHEEFVRMIDEAAELDPGSCVGNPAKISPSSPRTPKRTSADTEFDLGSALFSATADHSTAKKRRHAEAGREAKAAVQKAPKRKARKKLVLPQDSPQVMLHGTDACKQHILMFFKKANKQPYCNPLV